MNFIERQIERKGMESVVCICDHEIDKLKLHDGALI